MDGDFQPIIKSELSSLLYQSRTKVIFDIGACTGEDTVEYIKLFPNTSFHCFEPRNDNVMGMRLRFEKLKVANINICECALSDYEGTTTFYISSGRPEKSNMEWDYGNKSSSILPPSTLLNKHYPWLNFDTSIKVFTTTLERYCDKNNIRDIDFVHMDVQGAELSVLRGAGKLLKKIKLIWLEVENIELYEHQPLKRDVQLFMKKYKFIQVKDTSMGKIAGDCLFLNGRLLYNPYYFITKFLPFVLHKVKEKIKYRFISLPS